MTLASLSFVALLNVLPHSRPYNLDNYTTGWLRYHVQARHCARGVGRFTCLANVLTNLDLLAYNP